MDKVTTKLDVIFARINEVSECRIAITDLIESGILTDEVAQRYNILQAIKQGCDYSLSPSELNELWYRLVDYYVEEVACFMHDRGDLTFEERDQAIKERKLNPKFNNKPKETTTMNPKKAVEVITFVYGADIKTMSKDELLMAIREAKSEIEQLEKTGVESKYITLEVERLNKAIDTMVVRLDK